MSDPQPIIDDIRAFLHSSDQTLNERLKEVARQYAAACQEANQRLSRCAEYLRKGLRTEALHQAQTEPLLLDVVSTLDFPDRKQWEEMAAFYDLPVPPALNLEAAAALNEAYADDQPLEELLRKHRLFALARAALPARVRLLRRIAELDALNPVWKDDLREFEKARIRQIPQELAQATRGGNTTALLSLSEEISSPWTIALPISLVQQVQNAARQSHQSKTLVTLERLEPQLDEAMSAFDLGRAQQLRHEWQRHVTAARLDGRGPLFDRAQVVFDWVAEQERRHAEEVQYERAVAELQAGLDARLPRERLEGLAGQVLDFGRGMPDHVDARYRGRLQELKRKVILRRVALIGGPIAGLVVAVVLVGVYLSHANYTQKVETAQKELVDLLDANQMKKARVYIDGLAPDLRAAETVGALEVRLGQMEKAESERVVIFTQALDTARNAPLDDSGEGAVKRAEALGRLPGEIDAVNALKNDRAERITARNKERDDAFLPRIAALQTEVGKLEDMADRSGSDPQALAGLVYQQESQVSRLSADARDAGAGVRKRIEGLSVQLDKVRTKLGNQSKEVRLLDDLTRALSARQDVAGFVTAAEAVIKDFPNTDRARDLKRAIEEREHWQAVLDWNRLIKPRLAAPLDLSGTEAASLAADCEAFQKKYPAFPEQTAIELYVSSLKAYPQRDEAGRDTAAAELRSAFAGLMIKDLQMVRTPEGKMYYTNIEEDFDAQIKKSLDNYVRFPYLVSYDGKTKPGLLKLNLLEKYGPAPQSLLAAEVKRTPKNFGDKLWDKTLIALALKIKNNADMDPVLRVIFLKQVIEGAGKGSYPLWLALDESRMKLDKADIDLTVAWMDPDSKEAIAARPLAKEFLSQFPDLNAALKKATEVRETVESSIARSSRQPVGWLVRDQKKSWVCATTTAVPERSELAVVLPGGADGKAAWFVVGSAAKGVPSIDPFKQEGLVEGRWVFARKIEP